jgi:hypothetical protein
MCLWVGGRDPHRTSTPERAFGTRPSRRR